MRNQLSPLLPQMRALLPAGQGSQVKLVAANTTVSTTNGAKQRLGFLAYDVWRGDRHALVRLAILRRDGGAVVDTLYVDPLAGAAEKLNARSNFG